MNYFKNGLKKSIAGSLLLVGLLLHYSCQESNPLMQHEPFLSSIDKNVSLKDWKLLQFIDFEDNTGFEKDKRVLLEAKSGDTLVIVVFYFQYEDFKIQYLLSQHFRIFSDGKFFYEMMLEGKDTLYFLKNTYNILKLGHDNPEYRDFNEFILGKYYYQYRHHQINFYQSNFFKEHQDSLTKLRGNDLPPLPELE